MAQAKQKSSQEAARKRRKPKATKAKSQAKARAKAQSKPAEVVDAVEEKARAAEEKAKDAGKSVGRAAKKARVPLLAGGAMIAGAAGGAALASRQAHRHRGIANGLTHSVRRIDPDGVAKAAKRFGDVSARVGQFAVDLQRARESSNGAGNGSGRHRSPVEVVLQGLTARR